MDKIILPCMEFMACHGVYPIEKETPQLFRVSLEMATDITLAGETDDLNNTINYAQIYSAVKELVEKQTFDLIEKLATEIARLVLAEKGIDQVTVRVEKRGAQVAPDITIPACVEITRNK